MDAKKQKTFILGIDGGTFDIIMPLLNKGKLPNMQKIMQNGSYGTLYSTVPSLSPPAWVSFMTGCDPGHTGTYHFRKINIKEYDDINSQDLINSSNYRGRTFFDYLSKLGYSVGIMTVPVTYPTWEVNGFMVAGYPCPDPHDNPNFTYPPDLSGQIKENLNWTEIKNSQGGEGERRDSNDPQSLLEGGLKMMSRRTDYTLKFMKQFNSDLIVLVWGEIDRAQHKLWKFHDENHILHEANNPYKSYIERLYIHADAELGRILNEIDSQTRLFIVSDHGFGPKQGSFFHTNAWLNKEGYLKTGLKSKILNNIAVSALRGPVLSFFNKRNVKVRKKFSKAKENMRLGGINFSGTRVYKFPLDEKTEGLVINLKGRQSQGLVNVEDYEKLRQELIEKIKIIKDPRNGRPIIKKCYMREEIYTGDRRVEAPDIILTLDEGYYSGARLAGPVTTGIARLHLDGISGHHRPEGIFMAYGPDIIKGKLEVQASIVDIAPTILYSLKEKIPSNMTGHPLPVVSGLCDSPEFIDNVFDNGKESDSLSSSEEENMRNQLKDLGYL